MIDNLSSQDLDLPKQIMLCGLEFSSSFLSNLTEKIPQLQKTSLSHAFSPFLSYFSFHPSSFHLLNPILLLDD